MSAKTEPNQWWIGGTASAIAGVATHPLDSLKVRLQTTAAGVSISMLLADMIRNEPGGLLVLYKGVDASMLRQLTYSSARFAVYESAKESLQSTSLHAFSPLLARILAASIGGAVGGLVGSPADLVNVRMQIDGKLPPKERRNYKSAVHGIITIVQTEGLLALFNGVSANVLRAIFMTVGQIATYDTVKNVMIASNQMTDGFAVHFTASVLAALVATTICSPIDVIKSRIMAQRGVGAGTWGTGVQIWRTEGVTTFFKGWTPAFARLGPHTVLTFVVLEWIKSLWVEHQASLQDLPESMGWISVALVVSVVMFLGARTAYGILCHNNETISGSIDLIGLLWTPHDLFLIHIDSKAPPALVQSLHRHFSQTQNVIVLESAFNSGWGQIEIIGAELSLLQHALHLSTTHLFEWDMFVLLDGTAFPIQPLHTIKQRIQTLYQVGENVVYDTRGGTHRLTCTPLTSLINIAECNFHRGYCADWTCKKWHRTPHGAPVYKGTQWVVLTKPFAKHAVESDAAREWKSFLGGSFGSDETFFPSLLESSVEFRGTVAEGEGDQNVMFKQWSTFGCKTSKPTRGHGDGPCWLGGMDWEVIEKAMEDGFLFARKFKVDEGVKRRIMGVIHEKSNGANIG
ncbi:Mitochondrial dicarboxylate transporter [Podochytrium sp. JEL0797]|nr:Mitochondrial dicarboxylate transporter [Podochytrium sp. JEL0797]